MACPLTVLAGLAAVELTDNTVAFTAAGREALYRSEERGRGKHRVRALPVPAPDYSEKAPKQPAPGGIFVSPEPYGAADGHLLDRVREEAGAGRPGDQ